MEVEARDEAAAAEKAEPVPDGARKRPPATAPEIGTAS